ncbi:MAG: MbnP family protein [Bacteroidia bacterium]
MQTLFKHISCGLLFLTTIALLLIASCKGDNNLEKDKGKLIINVINQVQGKDLNLDTLIYKNAAGNTYAVSHLQYYLSNFQFTGSNCEDFIPENDYHLISVITNPNFGKIEDDFLFESTSFEYELPIGCFDQFNFSVGVDPVRNADGPYTEDLDFSWGMNWNWKGNYIYFKHEGLFINNDKNLDTFSFHIGGNQNYKTLAPFKLNKPIEVLKDESVTIDIYADINQFFQEPSLIDLNEVSAVSSPNSTSFRISNNFTNMFSYKIR